MEEVPVTASVGVDEPERVTEFTLVGVIEPKASVIAGVVVDVATVPLIPLAVVTLTLVTLPPPSATKSNHKAAAAAPPETETSPADIYRHSKLIHFRVTAVPN